MITQAQAIKRGYKPLTTAYKLPQEQNMLNSVSFDMQRGGIEYQHVELSKNSIEVWRK